MMMNSTINSTAPAASAINQTAPTWLDPTGYGRGPLYADQGYEGHKEQETANFDPMSKEDYPDYNMTPQYYNQG